MIQFTHNDHFKFGYNGSEWFRFRQSPDDRWTVRYGPCTRPSGNFQDECYATARLIRDSYDGPLTVLFSGGADSEIVVRSFHDQGIPIKVAIGQFTDNLNIHDISFAVVYCEQLGIPYQLISLDMERFLRRDVMDYAMRTQSRFSSYCSTMWLADQVDGVPIFGGLDRYLRKRTADAEGDARYAPSPWDLHEYEHVCSWYRHFMKQERKAIPGFFYYTPEIILSYVTDPIMVDLVNDRTGRLSTVNLKLPLYQKYFPLTERQKYDGYERLIQAKPVDDHLKEMFPVGLYLTEYNDLIAMLRGDA